MPKLSDLVGEHVLSGVDNFARAILHTYRGNKDCNAVVFVLDGVTYQVAEDEEDGYRSHADMQILGTLPKNTFPGRDVICTMEEPTGCITNCDILRVTDKHTGKVILRVGTDNTDYYYPYYVSEYNPTAMAD